MNFWKFNEDNLQGYYTPVNNANAYRRGQAMVNNLFFLFTGVLQIAGLVLSYLAILLFTILSFLIRLGRKKFPRRKTVGEIRL